MGTDTKAVDTEAKERKATRLTPFVTAKRTLRKALDTETSAVVMVAAQDAIHAIETGIAAVRLQEAEGGFVPEVPPEEDRIPLYLATALKEDLRQARVHLTRAVEVASAEPRAEEALGALRSALIIVEREAEAHAETHRLHNEAAAAKAAEERRKRAEEAKKRKSVGG